MANRAQPIPPLEKILANLKKQEGTVWGKLAGLGDAWFKRVEHHSVLSRYHVIFRRRTSHAHGSPRIDLDLSFIVSLTFHLLLVLFLAMVHVPSRTIVEQAPVVVRLIDPGPLARDTKMEPAPTSRSSEQPRARPALRPPVKMQKTADPPDAAPLPQPVVPEPPSPPLPGPRVLAETSRDRMGTLAVQTPESLVQLPTRSPSDQASPSSKADHIPSVTGDTDSSRVPAALQKGSLQAAPPSSNRAGGAATSSPDFGAYLAIIEKRVRSAWKYPEGITGIHNLSIVFVVDRSGNLIRAEIVDSSEQRLNVSALQAVRTAAPFPPIPDVLKDLAGEPMRIRFTVDSGIKRAK